MRLDDVTPVLLTYNEEPNIGRTLAALRWAKDIVVVDSGSTDGTLAILRSFPQVRVFARPFDRHDHQWNFAIGETGVATPWILTLDADYLVTEAGVRELEALDPPAAIAGYEAPFRMCVCGRLLRSSIYPPRTVLFRRGLGSNYQDGHTQRLAVAGAIGRLKEPIRHDDRKSLSRWAFEQDRYARLERDKLAAADPATLPIQDRIRRRGFLAPIAVLLYCLFRKGMIFDGWPGWFYTYQRVGAEVILSLYVIEEKLRAATPPAEVR
jgi:glycosyltransferase involved in cell wall biosynthesis